MLKIGGPVIGLRFRLYVLAVSAPNASPGINRFAIIKPSLVLRIGVPLPSLLRSSMPM